MMNHAGADADKALWHECKYAINLITDTYSTNWWVHAMRNLQLRIKNILDRDTQASLHAEKHPDAVPVVPKGDRRTQYLRIQQKLPSIWDMYQTRCNPHHRILDKLDQVLKQNLPVPVCSCSRTHRACSIEGDNDGYEQAPPAPQCAVCRDS